MKESTKETFAEIGKTGAIFGAFALCMAPAYFLKHPLEPDNEANYCHRGPYMGKVCYYDTDNDGTLDVRVNGMILKAGRTQGVAYGRITIDESPSFFFSAQREYERQKKKQK